MDILIRASKFLWVNLDLRGVLIKFIYEKLLSTVTKSGFLMTIIPISLGIINTFIYLFVCFIQIISRVFAPLILLPNFGRIPNEK
jgi:hypothetical protein